MIADSAVQRKQSVIQADLVRNHMEREVRKIVDFQTGQIRSIDPDAFCRYGSIFRQEHQLGSFHGKPAGYIGIGT